MCIPMTILGLIFSHDLANLKSGLFSHEPFEKRPVMIMQDSDLCFDDHCTRDTNWCMGARQADFSPAAAARHSISAATRTEGHLGGQMWL